MKLFLVVMIFFILSSLLIISNNNLAFYDINNIQLFFKLYSDWVIKIIKFI
jgi:hypothetical protein